MDNLHAQIDEKRRILRREYGGMMTVTQLQKEIGYRDAAHAKQWAESVGLDRIQIGRMKKYDTDQLARILVNARGMC